VDKKYLGQFFTNEKLVDLLLSFKKNNGKTLEPSCGDCAILERIPNCIGIEIDNKLDKKGLVLNVDFFSHRLDNKYDTIIGNPPYVRYQDIIDTTKSKLDLTLFDKRSNLYLFFIEKCIKHLKPNGELIFVVPREFFRSTSAKKLNKWLYTQGTITDAVDLGDGVYFDTATPNCVVFRFELGNFDRNSTYNGNKCVFKELGGQLLFLKQDYSIKFSDLFIVRVGGTSAAQPIFTSENGNIEVVNSETQATGKLRRMFYNCYSEELLPYKQELMDRKIRDFDESNWYMWGRNCYEGEEIRVYVNYRTRRKNPFFYNDCKYYDGSIFGIFPKFEINKERIPELLEDLNNVDWDEQGFMCGNRYLFSHTSLSNCYLPNTFKKYL